MIQWRQTTTASRVSFNFFFKFYLELLYLCFVTYVDIWVTFRVSCFSFSNKIRFIWTNLSFFFSVIMVDSCKAKGGLESHFLHWEFSLRHLIQFIFLWGKQKVGRWVSSGLKKVFIILTFVSTAVKYYSFHNYPKKTCFNCTFFASLVVKF